MTWRRASVPRAVQRAWRDFLHVEGRWNVADGSVVAHFDGLCEPNNPGGYACGGRTYRLVGGETVYGHRCFGHGAGWTNNRAECEAALACLRAVYSTGYRGAVLLRGDSQLVVRQFEGRYGCASPHLIPLLGRLRTAARCFASLRLEWVRREENEVAGEESRAAYREATGREPPVRGRKPPVVREAVVVDRYWAGDDSAF